VRATVTVAMVNRYFVPSYISDNLCIPSIVIRYFMLFVYVISVIIMEYMISYREIGYLVNRCCIVVCAL